jgi:hypothetical protein
MSARKQTIDEGSDKGSHIERYAQQSDSLKQAIAMMDALPQSFSVD